MDQITPNITYRKPSAPDPGHGAPNREQDPGKRKRRIMRILLVTVAAAALIVAVALLPFACGTDHDHAAAHYTANASSHWKVCDTCGESYGKESHTFNLSGVCTVCGYVKTYTDGLVYSAVNDGNGNAAYEVTGMGNANDSKIIIPSYHEGKPVIGIAYTAFCDNNNLTSIEIPGSIEHIDPTAFYGCSNLSSVTIWSGVTNIGVSAFYDCSSLTSIVIPDSVTTVGDHAFYGCNSLANIVMHDSVTSIGKSAFYDTAYYNNESNWTNGVLYIGKHVIAAKDTISGSYSIEQGTLTIADYAFAWCNNLYRISIPESVTNIGNKAFYCSSGITTINLPDGVVNVGVDAFYNTGYYNNDYNWNNSVLYVDNHLVAAKSNISGACTVKEGTLTIACLAFKYCSSLTSIEIPESVTHIGDGAFFACSNLISITVAAENRAYRSSGNCLVEISSKTLIAGCKNSVIPTDGSVKCIGNFAFSGYSSLTSATIPNGITTIKNGAFWYCSNLTEVEIPKSVVSIGDSISYIGDLPSFGAFFDCPSITSISVAKGNANYSGNGNCLIDTACKTLIRGCNNSTIPTDGSVTNIGSAAFFYCTELKSINIPDSVINIGLEAFTGCSGLTTITMGAGVKNIGHLAFEDCNNITSVYYTGDIADWCAITFNFFSDSSIVSGITSNPLHNGADLYINNEPVTDIVIPNTVSEIKDASFIGCSSLTSVIMPNSVTSIGRFAFSDCSSLTSVVVPSSVTSIGSFAFSDCSSLTSIVVPSSVTSIGDYAFSYDNSLTIYCEAIKAPADWDSDWNYSDCPVVWDCTDNDEDKSGYKYTVISGIRYRLKDCIATVIRQPSNISGAITIPSSITYNDEIYEVTSIGETAFGNCSGLTSIVIPNTITGIERYAFGNCSNLTDIKFDGTKEQWEAVSKANYWNSLMGDYTITCTDGAL